MKWINGYKDVTRISRSVSFQWLTYICLWCFRTVLTRLKNVSTEVTLLLDTGRYTKSFNRPFWPAIAMYSHYTLERLCFRTTWIGMLSAITYSITWSLHAATEHLLLISSTEWKLRWDKIYLTSVVNINKNISTMRYSPTWQRWMDTSRLLVGDTASGWRPWWPFLIATLLLLTTHPVLGTDTQARVHDVGIIKIRRLRGRTKFWFWERSLSTQQAWYLTALFKLNTERNIFFFVVITKSWIFKTCK